MKSILSGVPKKFNLTFLEKLRIHIAVCFWYTTKLEKKSKPLQPANTAMSMHMASQNMRNLFIQPLLV